MTDKRARGGLGRGLSALMADVEHSHEAAPGSFAIDRTLAIESLVPNPDQPRKQFDPGPLQELAASIREKGIVQPLIVRPSSIAGKFEIVAGERRWRAAQAAGLHQVPVLIRDYSDEEVLEVAIIENIQRADLNSLDEALAYRQLMDRFGHTQEKLATSLSRSRSHIANTLRLLALPDTVQDLVRNGSLTAGHARALITAPNAAQLASLVVKRGLSVRETEKLMKRSAQSTARQDSPDRSTGPAKDADTKALELDLSAGLGLNVIINHKGETQGGTLTISYLTLDDLDRLCTALSTVPRAPR
jgi:ParB family chromosome partitioning protein